MTITRKDRRVRIGARVSGVAWLAIALVVAITPAGWSDGHGKLHAPERLKKDARGYAEYQQYCASCHGVWADGEGLLKPVLTVAPTNLRTLEQRHGSPFPRERILEYIDGRRPVIAHGSREMPVWGRRLDENVDTSVPDMRKRSMMMVIIDYLEAIQEKG